MTGRFAPTPSGRMHIGNITAMLAAWLDSRARGQRMLLRIEDIDTPRVLPDADRWIMDDLAWLGLDWDGEPVYQSRRLDLYEQAFRLLAEQPLMPDAEASPGSHSPHNPHSPHSPHNPHAVSRDVSHAAPCVSQNVSQNGSPCATPLPLIYPCFCSRADIRAASAPNEGDGFQVYPGTCRRLMREHPDEVRTRLARGDRHSWRIAMPEPAIVPVTDSDGDEPFVHAHADIHADADVQYGYGSRSRDVTFDDRVFGPQRFDLAHDIGDSVIRRSDGLFGYQFVVTVDDLAMGVDLIVRGRDLLRSTALQAYIRERLLASALPAPTTDRQSPADKHHAQAAALLVPSDEGAVGEETAGRRSTGGTTTPASDASPAHPAYAHVPLIDNAAGRRLAKRERSLDMGALRSRGVTDEQVTGVCAWLLRLTDKPEPCTAGDALELFRAHGWAPLQARHEDRRLDPADPALPGWLTAALTA
ncbi:glutamate--tRNA ligase family protein [Bifidobacterium aesculapii]|uniref:glutamate--tRNA ligase family protein n=1 Tax=Bifidobacterium aesculapii TaxID=1329411 RepID=UPI0006E17B18|nr:glutamate--tRNA ligase family protein [Bifidobacterium aesculapii]